MCCAVNVRSLFSYLGSLSSSFPAPSFLNTLPLLSLALETVDLSLHSFLISFDACIQEKSLNIPSQLLVTPYPNQDSAAWPTLRKFGRDPHPPASITGLRLTTHDIPGLAILRFIFRAIASSGIEQYHSQRSL